MPYEIQMIQQKLSDHRGRFTFTFSANVLSYVVGISYWDFRFDSNGSIEQLSLSNLNFVEGGLNGKTVTIVPDAVMVGSKNIDLSKSTLTLTCVAKVGPDDGSPTALSFTNDPSDQTLDDPSLGNPIIFPTGWTAVQNGSKSIHSFELDTKWQGGASVEATSSIATGSKDPVKADCNAGAIDGSQAGFTWFTHTMKDVQGGQNGQPAHVPIGKFPKKVSGPIGMFIVCSKATFSSGQSYDIQRIFAGCYGIRLESDQQTVTVTYGKSSMWCGGNLWANYDLSPFTVVVFGTPASNA